MATTFSGEQAIEALYVGYYGRAGDPSGTNYWLQQLNGGLSITQIAASFSVQTESTTLYPFLANPTVGGSTAVTTFITQVYQDLFNRAPDASGLSYWTSQLQAANGSPAAVAQFILNVITGAQGTDQLTIQNKVTVAQDFTDSLSAAHGQYNGAAAAVAHSVVQSTTSDPTTVTTQEAAVIAFTGQAISGTPVLLTTGIDTVNTPNVAISGVLAGHSATSNTLNVGDLIGPTGTNNSLNITSSVSGVNYTATDIPTLNNVQALNVNNVAAGTTAFTLTGISPALTSIGISGLGSTDFLLYNGMQITTFNVTNITAASEQFFQANPGLTSGGVASGTATLNLANDPGASGSGQAMVVFASASATDGYSSLSVNSNGTAANDLNTLQVNATLATLNIAGAAALKVDNSISFAGGVVNIQAGTDTGGLNIDVSGNTGKLTFVGGTAGTESLTISESSLVASGTSLAGGAGTSDTLTVAFGATSPTAADYTALNKVTGFEILGLSNTGAITVDDSQITATFNNHFALSGAAGVTINHLVDNAIVDELTNAGGVFSGAIGAHTININVGSTTSGGLNDTFTVTGYSTVNFSSNGTSLNDVNTVNSDGTSFKVTGSDGFLLNVAVATTLGDSVDASGLSGSFTYLDSEKGDVIFAGSGTTLIEGFGKADTITLLVGHTNVDTLEATNTAAGFGSTANFDKVTHFVLNQDVLKSFAGTLVQGTSTDLTGTTNGSGVVAPAAFANSTAFINAAEGSAGSAGHTVAWSDGANTWVAEFTGTANQAHIVELVGVNNVTSVGGSGAGHLLVG